MTRRTPVRKGREDRGAAQGPRSGAPPSAAILDTAFRRAYRATPHGDTYFDRSRRRAKLKIIRSGAVTVRHLTLERRPFLAPGLTDFQRSLVARNFGATTLDRAVERVGRAEDRIRGLLRDSQAELKRASTTDEFAICVRRFYGRMASFVREVDEDIRALRDVRSFLKARPELDPALPTVVVAGFPNVGKSSLVAKLSTANPKVAAYPFTTLSVSVGHADLGFDRLQVLDTPGVLGRRQENDAEAEAELAVSRAATVVLFVLDPTESCGYSVDEQERLLGRWRLELPGTPFVVVETKSDLQSRSTDRLHVSAVSGEGLEALQEEIHRILTERRVASGAPAVEDWPDWSTRPPEGEGPSPLVPSSEADIPAASREPDALEEHRGGRRHRAPKK